MFVYILGKQTTYNRTRLQYLYEVRSYQQERQIKGEGGLQRDDHIDQLSGSPQRTCLSGILMSIYILYVTFTVQNATNTPLKIYFDFPETQRADERKANVCH